VKKILLTLSGTHGSGKSTNAGKCYYLLNRSGYKFSYIRHQDILDPFGFVVRRTARILHLEPNRLERMRPTRVAWSIYLLFIYCPILVGGIRLRHLFGYSVVSDRYLYDVMVGFRDNGVTVPSEDLLMRLLPRPDISFVLDAPEQRILVERQSIVVISFGKKKFSTGKLLSISTSAGSVRAIPLPLFGIICLQRSE